MIARSRPGHARQKYLDLGERAQGILKERSDPRPWIESTCSSGTSTGG